MEMQSWGRKGPAISPDLFFPFQLSIFPTRSHGKMFFQSQKKIEETDNIGNKIKKIKNQKNLRLAS